MIGHELAYLTIAYGETYTVTASIPRLVGGPGSDVLNFGAFRAAYASGWNGPTGSGGAYAMSDPMTGLSWTMEFSDMEVLVGSPYDDRLFSNSQISELHGGEGNDTLIVQMDSPILVKLRGGPGADSLSGDAAFDDIHGNQGNDIAHGWEGDDWVVGGQDDDVLYGDTGHDIVLGNLGVDALDGGDGNDLIRGGQGNDSIIGGAGDDWIAGDLGSDTISGGAGADTFHAHGGVELDLILDFNRAEGDRLDLLPGSQPSVAQVGADVVVSLSGGGHMVLAGVQLSSLTDGWITAG